MDYDKHYNNGRRKFYDELIASMGTSPEKIVFSLNERISELEKDKKIYETFMKKLYIYYKTKNIPKTAEAYNILMDWNRHHDTGIAKMIIYIGDFFDPEVMRIARKNANMFEKLNDDGVRGIKI